MPGRITLPCSIFASLLSLNTQAGAWDTQTNTDPISDERTVFAVSYSLNKQDYQHARLVAYCRNNKYLAVQMTNTGLLINDNYPIKWRTDNNRPHSTNWKGMKSSDALWSNDLESMIIEMVRGNRLAIRIERKYSHDLTYHFSLAGFTKASQPVLSACNYSLKNELAKEEAAKVANQEYMKKIEELENTPNEVILKKFQGRTIKYINQTLNFVGLGPSIYNEKCKVENSVSRECRRLIFKSGNTERRYMYNELVIRGFTFVE